MIDFNYIVKIHKKLITSKINKVLTLDEIIEKFKYHLEGENIRFSVYIDLRDSFLIQYKLTNNKTYKEIYENLYFILSNFKFEDNFNDDKESFSVAYNYCIYAKEKNLFKPTHLHISAKVKCLIESLTFFKSKGINNLFNNGSVNFKKIIEIENIIDKKFKDIGIDSIPAIFSMIPKLKKQNFILSLMSMKLKYIHGVIY
ncbi:hypothetical protein [Acinetobacter baumannii]|uniref:hypothetical protein n=1 Tax=Acinetobacter baumannii TaxID=470 RepID=UPI00333E4755